MTKSGLGMTSNDKPIIFFDGVCGLCNRFVDFIFRIDKTHNLNFAPLQGETAQKELDNTVIARLETIVYKNEQGIFFKSTAVLAILKKVGGFWTLSYCFILIPTILRDLVYNFIAKHRYAWFGKWDQCRLPSREEKKFFLL